MIVKVLIVDDEPNAREGIRLRLKGHSDVEIVGECSSGEEAVHSIDGLRPDLLFLDIQMPGMNGFEVLRKVSVDPMPIVVFVTAYDKYAVKAFEFHALDYLLKPIEDERFDETVRFALSRMNQRNLEAYAKRLKEAVDNYPDRAGDSPTLVRGTVTSSANYLERIAVKAHDRIYMLPVSNIDWIESGGDYIYLHAESQKHIVRQTMTSLEQKIDPMKFVRIHRSAIVNVDSIKSLHPNEHGDYDVYLKTGEKLKLSRSYRNHFQEVIGNSL